MTDKKKLKYFRSNQIIKLTENIVITKLISFLGGFSAPLNGIDRNTCVLSIYYIALYGKFSTKVLRTSNQCCNTTGYSDNNQLTDKVRYKNT